MKIQRTFQALSDPTRRQIISLLHEGELHAGQIAEHFQTSDATISHHLTVLKKAGLVLAERRGKYIYYELNMSVLEEIIRWISSLTGKEQP